MNWGFTTQVRKKEREKRKKGEEEKKNNGGALPVVADGMEVIGALVYMSCDVICVMFQM